VVRLQNIDIGRFLNDDHAYISHRHAASLGKHDAQPGDLLVASLGDERHPLARACLYPAYLNAGIVKADCFRIRLDPGFALNSFAMRALNSQLVKPAVNAAAQGVTRDRVNLTTLLSVKLPLPPIDFQRRTVQLLDSQDNVLHAAECELSKLQSLKKGLMEDLLTGRVRVSNLC
jgi:type I restriction enzyme S subunit